MIKPTKKILIVLMLSVLMISMVTATAYAVNTPQNDKKDTGTVIESKEKSAGYKITWNGNGGKIGNKNTVATTAKKGSKIGKLTPTTPKLSGHTFKGWYSKKIGGVKVNKNTVPKKSTTYYAQWGKTLTTSEKRMVGTWNMKQSAGSTSLSVSYIFREDKTYSSLTLRISSDNRGRVSSSKSQSIGSWSVSGNTIHFTNRQFQSNNNNWMSIADSSLKLRLGSDEKGQYFLDDYDRKTYKS